MIKDQRLYTAQEIEVDVNAFEGNDVRLEMGEDTNGFVGLYSKMFDRPVKDWCHDEDEAARHVSKRVLAFIEAMGR